jgi:hypothetical protein
VTDRHPWARALARVRATAGPQAGVEALGIVLDREQGRAMLDERTRRMLGMSLEEFEAAHDAGQLDEGDGITARLVMLLPFARDVPAE